MGLSNFARIGKGVITKLIGLQDNYIEYYTKEEPKRDEEKSGCFSCPVYQAKCQMSEFDITDAYEYMECQCGGCSQAVFTDSYTVTKKYINEKNRFGYQQTLKSYPIKIFLILHFLGPDSHGLIMDVSIKELAGLAGCSAATVRAAVRKLSECGYIQVCESGSYDNHINVLITEYSDYHKTAEEGGRGYITMSSDMMGKLLGIKRLNTLRLNLKGILEVDSASLQTGGSEMASATATYKKLQGFLPKYCRRNVIISALKQDSSIFHFDYSDQAVTFNINPEFSQRNMRDSMLKNEESVMRKYIENLNRTLLMAGMDYVRGADPLADAHLSALRITEAEGYIPLQLADKDYKDLASMCVQFNRDIVRKAVITAYNQYTAQGQTIKNFGGMIRTIILGFQSSGSTAA